ncbi:MAG: LexA family protein [Lautropia sp.]
MAALRTYVKRHGMIPSMGRLCGVLGLSSTGSVFALLKRLTEAGFLERVDGRIVPTKRFFARPLLGTVRAGLPQPEDQSQAEALTIDDFLIDDPNRTSLHRVRGDSMRDAGILEGDLVTVEHASPAAPGDIVLAVVDGELTVKTLRLDDEGRFFLEAANPSYGPIRPGTSLEVVGIVTGIVRRLRR